MHRCSFNDLDITQNNRTLYYILNYVSSFVKMSVDHIDYRYIAKAMINNKYNGLFYLSDSNASTITTAFFKPLDNQATQALPFFDSSLPGFSRIVDC
jgi:hypothetical protein